MSCVSTTCAPVIRDRPGDSQLGGGRGADRIDNRVVHPLTPVQGSRAQPWGTDTFATLPRRYWQDMRPHSRESDTASWIVRCRWPPPQHWPHLPVYTDTCIAEGMVRRAIEPLPDDLPVTFLPVQAIGKSNEHISSPGTLTSTWETTTKLWLDIGDSVRRAGIRKLIIVNSHGGNVPMVDIVARELRVRHEMLAVATAWSRFGQPDGISAAEEGSTAFTAATSRHP